MPLNRKRLVYFEFFLAPVAAKILGEREDIELVRLKFSSPAEENWEAFSRACGYHVLPQTELREPWFGNAALIARAPNLLAMCSTGAGYDVIDVDACTKAGIIVCNQTGLNYEAVAEHAVGMMIALSKKISLLNRAIQKQAGIDRNLPANIGSDVRGKTIGVVGVGNIGKRTTEICRLAFGMTVLAYDPYLSKEQLAARGATKVELGELLQKSDYISVHCPRTKETIGMFGAAEFAQMKPSAYFINTARGLIHKEKDLHDALTQGRIAGAGIDVFDKEPPAPDHPLLKLDNVIATPHVAGVTFESHETLAVGTAEQWIAILNGEVPPRLVNPEAWPLYAQRFEQIVGFRPQSLP
jgi:D-3-phosphoglycerate dehydrogenase